MTKVLKDLILALLNATLILVALCLFLLWKLSDTVDGVTDNLAQHLAVIAPLRGDIEATRADFATLRSDLASLKANPEGVSPEVSDRIVTHMDMLAARMDQIGKSVEEMAKSPGQLIDRAIETTADQFAIAVSRVRGCVPAAD